MDNIDDYSNYWETRRFLHNEELELELELDGSWIDETRSDYYAPDGTQMSAASKNIVSERNRRQKLNQRLLALRAVVPNITKMDKASIIKDAIDHIGKLHEERSMIQEEIKLLELENNNYDIPVTLKSKKKKTDPLYCSGLCPIEVLEMKIVNMGEKTIVVSLTCNKRMDTTLKLCEMFESLNLKTVSSNVTTFSDKVLQTVFVQAEGNGEEKDHIKMRIENAIATLNYAHSPGPSSQVSQSGCM